MKKKDELTGDDIFPVEVNENGVVVSGFINSTETEGEIEDYYNGISGYIYQNQQSAKQVKKQIAIKRYFEKVDIDNRYAQLNKKLEERIGTFIDTQRSELTKKRYRAYIKAFQKYCIEKGIDFVQAGVDKANEYLIYLNKKYASRTVRLHIATLSSFWGYFQKCEPDLIKVNAFLRMKIPAIRDKFDKDFPTEKDVKALCRRLKQINRPDIICIVELLYKYGWRIGIFKEMKIEADGRWKSESKGKEMKGKFIKREYESIISNKVLKLNMNIVSSQITRMTKRLFRDGKISCSFSAHDLRRARMLIEAEEIDIKPLMEFSKKYHKDVSTTINYFKAKFGL